MSSNSKLGPWVSGISRLGSMRTSRSVRSQEGVPSLFQVGTLNDVDVFELSISELHELYKQSAFTIKEYVRFCLDRIHAVDHYLEAVIEVNPDALEIAAALDEELRDGRIRSIVHGLPILVKDNIATKDKMQTTAGSWALLGSIVPRDAHAVTKLRKAGGVIIGHANLSEWVSTRSRYYSDGYSPRRGQCRNPFDLRRSPFGSSGGPAVSVASNYTPLAIATETDGSIAGPSQINGVVGLKPTPGVVSRAGVIAVSDTWDTVGPMARSVFDVALALSIVAGHDPRDSRTSTVPSRKEDYTTFVASKDALKGARFGYPVKGAWEHVPEGVRKVAEKIFDGIRACGGEVVPVEYPCAEERIPPNGKWDWEYGSDASKREYTVVKTEAYRVLNAYLSELEGTEIQTFDDIVAYNRRNAGTEGDKPGDHSAFPTGQDIFYEIAEQKGVEDETYRAALKHVRQQTRDRGIDAALKHTLPSGETVELDALLLSDRQLTGQQVAAQAGYPTITIPIGIDEAGAAVGLTLQQTAWQEDKLIKWASAIEDLRNSLGILRPIPTFKYHMSKVLPIRGGGPIEDE